MQPSLSSLLIAARGALSTSEVAARAGVSVRSIQAWESGRLPTRTSLGMFLAAMMPRRSHVRDRIEAAWRCEKAAQNAKRRGVQS